MNDILDTHTLNRFTHNVRRKQVVLQYGVGAMVDFPTQVLMTSAPEKWVNPKILFDERLQKLLEVDKFIMPSELESVSFVRFPEWYFCPKCRRFKPLREWIKEYNHAYQNASSKKYLNLLNKLICSKDSQELVPARLVTVCKQGHIDDFPWVKWVHKKNFGGPKQVCAHPQLLFKTGSSASSGLEGVTVSCTNCKATASLSSAFDQDDNGKNIFEQLSKEGSIDFKCTGRHPWKHFKEDCDEYPITQQRGSSSVYFPKTISSLVIPPFSDFVNRQIEESKQFEKLLTVRESLLELNKDESLELLNKKFAKHISEEINVSDKIIDDILKRKFSRSDDYKDVEDIELYYKSDEWKVLTGKYKSRNHENDFRIEFVDTNLYKIPGIQLISLVHKITEVTALIGFSRIRPIGDLYEDNEFLVSIKEPLTRYYPACNSKGEGIFLSFDKQAIQNFFSNSDQNLRFEKMHDNFNKSYIGKNSRKIIDLTFVFLHTLSHLLIKELSINCGYPTASIRERIYYGEAKDEEMCGLFIYTSGGDEEGTLGGLVRQGRSDTLPKIFRESLMKSQFCANDPVCSFSSGQGLEGLNYAACHSCTLLPETSCENNNCLLDRTILIGRIDNLDRGFYSHWIKNKF